MQLLEHIAAKYEQFHKCTDHLRTHGQVNSVKHKIIAREEFRFQETHEFVEVLTEDNQKPFIPIDDHSPSSSPTPSDPGQPKRDNGNNGDTW